MAKRSGTSSVVILSLVMALGVTPGETRRAQAATAIEYGLIAAGISVAIIAVVQGLGGKLNDTFTKVSNALSNDTLVAVYDDGQVDASGYVTVVLTEAVGPFTEYVPLPPEVTSDGSSWALFLAFNGASVPVFTSSDETAGVLNLGQDGVVTFEPSAASIGRPSGPVLGYVTSLAQMMSTGGMGWQAAQSDLPFPDSTATVIGLRAEGDGSSLIVIDNLGQEVGRLTQRSGAVEFVPGT